MFPAHLLVVKSDILVLFRFYVEQRSSQTEGPTCTEGDVMGCGVDYSELKDDMYVVYFTKNGERVSMATKQASAN